MEDKKRTPSLQFTASIRTRLLALLLGLTLLSVVAIGALAAMNSMNASKSAEEKSSAQLRSQVEESLVSLNLSMADRNDEAMRQAYQQAESVALYAANIFDNPEAFATEDYWQVENHMYYGSEGQYINSKTDKTTVFIPNNIVIDEKLKTDLEYTAYLDLIFEPVFRNTPNVVAIYIITANGISRLYPNIDLGAILPADYQPTKDIFYTAGAPENNINRKTVFTPIYEDPAGQGLLISAIAPIYTSDNKFIGIIGIDIGLANLTTQLSRSTPIFSGYSMLIDNEGRAIVLPEKGYQDFLGRAPEPGEFGTDLNAAIPELKPLVETLKSSSSGFGSTGFESVKVGEKELLVAYAPLKNTPWVLASVVPASEIFQAVYTLQTELQKSTQTFISERLFPYSLVIFIVVIVIGLFMTNRLIDPIQKLAAAAQKIGSGAWDTPLPKAGRDELGVLTYSFATMTAQLRDLVEGLEQRVAERTRAIETSAEVSRRLSTILDLNRLAKEVVEQLQSAFDYYHAHIYLLDDTKENLVMVGGTGEAGQVMLARGHKIPWGRGLVGRAAETNDSVLVGDTSQDPDWLPNPLLPDTKSELAVPIAIGNEVIGVLDVQQNVPGGLTENDAILIQAIASQVAVAVQNARAFAKTQQRAEREAIVASIRDKIQSTTTIEDALKITVREIGKAVGAPKTMVRLGADHLEV